jgi:hypothetical protein
MLQTQRSGDEGTDGTQQRLPRDVVLAGPPDLRNDLPVRGSNITWLDAFDGAQRSTAREGAPHLLPAVRKPLRSGHGMAA